MKGRPRSIERKVAEILSREFVDHGWSPVERIPVLGRTGPDITINEAEFVIDVKSRLEVPKTILVPKGKILCVFGDLIAFRLENINGLFHKIEMDGWIKSIHSVVPKVVRDYYDHMNEWTQQHEPHGITMLVLHRSGIHGGRMPVGASSVVISYSDYQKFI